MVSECPKLTLWRFISKAIPINVALTHRRIIKKIEEGNVLGVE